MSPGWPTQSHAQPADTPPLTVAQEEHIGRRKRPKVPHDQRKRVKSACQPCRKHKLRCDGGSPCERCATTRKKCAYRAQEPEAIGVANERPRSVPALNHPSDQNQDEQLQLLRQIFTMTYPDLPVSLAGFRTCYSRLVLVGTSSRRTTSYDGADDEDTARGSSRVHLTNGSEVLDRREREQEDDGLIYSHAHDPAPTVTVVNQGKTHFEGTSSLWSFFSSVKHAVTNGIINTDSDGEADSGGKTIHQLSNIGFGVDWKTAVLQALPPQTVVDFLTKSYFRYAQTNYFCVHPEVFSRKLAAFYDGSHEFAARNMPDSRKSAEFISVLFMVLAIGSQFAEFGETHKESPVADESEILSYIVNEPHRLSQLSFPVPEQNPGWRFYEVSRRLLPDVISSSSMASVQVCFLQGVFLPSTTSRDAGYNMLGLALRMAINMGLHRSFCSESLHPHVSELRSRLWWSIYAGERLYSVEMGRPLSISDAEIDARLPQAVPEWSEFARVDGLVALTRLCRILGSIVDATYGKPADKRTVIRPKVIRRLRSEIHESYASLPSDMKYEKNQSRGVAYIALMYEQAKILLTRTCLNGAVASRDASHPFGEEASRFLHQQAQYCAESAIKSLSIMSSLRWHSLLCTFSFHDAIYCSSSIYVLLLANQKLKGLVTAPREHIARGILILLDLAQGSEAALSSLHSVIDAIISQHPGPPGEQGSRSSLEASTAGEGSIEKGRNAWKAWMNSQPSCLPPSGGSHSASGNMIGGIDVFHMRDDDTDHLDSFWLSPDEVSAPSHGSDIAPFCVPANIGFTVFGREQGIAPDIQTSIYSTYD